MEEFDEPAPKNTALQAVHSVQASNRMPAKTRRNQRGQAHARTVGKPGRFTQAGSEGRIKENAPHDPDDKHNRETAKKPATQTKAPAGTCGQGEPLKTHAGTQAEEKDAAHAAAALWLTKLLELDTYTLEYLARCLDIHNRDRGATTPFEEFFTSLTYLGHRDGDAPTPKDVERELEDFKLNFNEAIETARMMGSRYPNAMNALTDSELPAS